MGFNYSIAIRTLGKSGEKFEKELKSIYSQTILPKDVIIYLAEGYDVPAVRIGMEKYVYVKKGMVAQRALRYEEIETEYVLLLDDDVFLPPHCVEVLAKELMEMDGDCIAADVFQPQNATWRAKTYDILVNLCFPRRDDNWAFKVRRNAAFSYNNSPQNKAYLSQSAAGPISLWKKSTLLDIHYTDELWLDQVGFAFGDDQLMFQKVYKNGYRLLVSYDSGAVHMDAKSSSGIFRKSNDMYYKRAKAQYMLWFRSCFFLKNQKKQERWFCSISFITKLLVLFIIHLTYSILKLRPVVLLSFIKGNIHGFREARKSLRHIPNFILK